ncbi:MAG: sigma-70 family RNA polymerase sigma factor [Bacteroidetes bacterium]|nr:sigma-70 family RNA polymerase sigma factor [Bacteroidota bacterium]
MVDSADNILIEKILRGNLAAFTDLVDKYKSFIFTLALRILDNREDAEEVSQDVFLKVFKSLQSFRKQAKFSTWLYKITYNTAISRLRKQKGETETVELNIEHFENIESENVKNQVDLLQREQQKMYIEKAIKKLSEDDRVVISLFYLGEMSVKEIAKIIARSQNSVKVKLHRARKMIYKELNVLLKGELKEII